MDLSPVSQRGIHRTFLSLTVSSLGRQWESGSDFSFRNPLKSNSLNNSDPLSPLSRGSLLSSLVSLPWHSLCVWLNCACCRIHQISSPLVRAESNMHLLRLMQLRRFWNTSLAVSVYCGWGVCHCDSLRLWAHALSCVDFEEQGHLVRPGSLLCRPTVQYKKALLLNCLCCRAYVIWECVYLVWGLFHQDSTAFLLCFPFMLSFSERHT